MARVNRFTNITPTRYNPRSLQELMMVPAYKREQHTAIEDSLGALDAELAKVDPLDVHSDMATQEQAKYRDLISSQAEQLSSKGFNPTSKSDLLRLNRQYQQAISPTGTIGKINAAKQQYAQEYKSFMDAALKKWDRDTALRNWQAHSQKYTGFNEIGDISNITGLGAPEKVELSEKLKDAKALLGEQVVKELTAGQAQMIPQPDGSLKIVNRNGRRIETSNEPNIQAAMRMINAELQDPNSAWNKSIAFEGLSREQLYDQITGGFNAMLTTKVTDNRRESINLKGYENSTLNNQYVPSVTEPVENFSNNRESLSNNLLKIGKPKREAGLIANMPWASIGTEIEGTSIGNYTEQDLGRSEREQYDNIYNSMIESGYNLDDNKYSEKNVEIINAFLQGTKDLAYSNKIMKPFAVDNDIQKPLSLQSNAATNSHLLAEFNGGRRKLIDKDTQEVLDVNSLNIKGINYIGMLSPDNVETPNNKTTMSNSNVWVMPHVVQVKLDDGTTKEYYMDRDVEEYKKPEFRASAVIKDLALKSKQSPTLVASVNNDLIANSDFASMKVKYNPSNDTYDLAVVDKNNSSAQYMGITSAELQAKIYSGMIKKK